MNQLKMSQSEKMEKYPMWQILGREAVAHVKSRDFRDQFYKLIRNDDIHVRLASLHMFLLADRVRTINSKQENISLMGTPYQYAELKRIQLRFAHSRYPQSFKNFMYYHFYSHLPEDLFFDDFVSDLKSSDRITNKKYS